MQTTINDHFTPSPSRPPRTHSSSTRHPPPRRSTTMSDDSEGSEGLAAITMTQHAPINRNLPISMKRALKKAVYDSEDEERDAEERFDEDEEGEEIDTPKPKKKRISKEGKRPKRRDGAEGEISIPIGLKMGQGDETDDGDDEEENPRRRSLRGRPKARGKGKGKQVELDEDEGDEDDEIVDITTPPPARKKASQLNDSIIIDDDTVPAQSTETIPIPSPSPLPTDEVIQTPPAGPDPSPPAARPNRATRSSRFKAPVPLQQVTDEQPTADAPRRSGRNAKAATAKFVPPARVTKGGLKPQVIDTNQPRATRSKASGSASKSPEITMTTLPVKAAGKTTAKSKAKAGTVAPVPPQGDVAGIVPGDSVQKRNPSFVIDPPLLSQEQRVSYSKPSSTKTEEPAVKRAGRSKMAASAAQPEVNKEATEQGSQDQVEVSAEASMQLGVDGAEAESVSVWAAEDVDETESSQTTDDPTPGKKDVTSDIRIAEVEGANKRVSVESHGSSVNGKSKGSKSEIPQDRSVSPSAQAVPTPEPASNTKVGSLPAKSAETAAQVEETSHTAFGIDDINDDDLAILTDTEVIPPVTTDDDDTPIIMPPSSTKKNNPRSSLTTKKDGNGVRKTSPEESDDDDVTFLSVNVAQGNGKKRQTVEDDSDRSSQPVKRKSTGKKVFEDDESPEQVTKGKGKDGKRTRDESDSPGPVRNGGRKGKGRLRADSDVSSLLPSQPPVSKGKRKAVNVVHSGEDSASEDFDTLFDDLNVPKKTKSTKSKNPVNVKTYGSKGKKNDTAQKTGKSTSAGPSKTTKSSEPSGKSQPKSNDKRPQKSKSSKDDAEANDESDDQDMQDIEMDEPERFQSDTRLRKRKETEFQRRIRKLKARRGGVDQPDTESSGSESDVVSEDHESGETSDSVADSDGPDTDDFIVDDGGELEEGLLPHEFSLNSAQTPEFKFKVVFHYFVLLVVRGTGVLPLTGDTAEYLLPQLEDLRRRVMGYRDARVRSQIWRREFVQALEKFPDFVVHMLDFTQLGCDACHMSGRQSRYKVLLRGDVYDRETHEPIVTDSEEEAEKEERKKRRAKKERAKARRKERGDSTESDSGSSEGEDLPREFMMGRFCERRSRVYHKMSHWEDVLYYRIKGHWHDLLRARKKPVPSDSEASSSDADEDEDPEEVAARKEAREARRRATAERVGRLKRGGKGDLPTNCRDVDQVTEWMDKQGYPNAEYHWMDSLIRESESLENDRSTDD